jgi:hypothetical protein
MLSKENKNKIVHTGLYRCEPNKKYRSQLYWNDMYHCSNWTFVVHHCESDDTWYMVDTYFNDKYIELTDENFDEFEFLFDFNEVEKHSGKNIYDYDENDWWHVATDSGGMRCGGKFYLKRNALPKKEKILNRLKEEIDYAERNLEYMKDRYQRVMNGEVDLRYV